MDRDQVMEQKEENIRQRVALATEQLLSENTKGWVTLTHLIEAIEQLRR